MFAIVARPKALRSAGLEIEDWDTLIIKNHQQGCWGAAAPAALDFEGGARFAVQIGTPWRSKTVRKLTQSMSFI